MVGQNFVDEQVGHFFKGGIFRQVVDIIAAVMQLFPIGTHGTDGGLPGGHTGQRDRFLFRRLRGYCLRCITHS